MSVPIPKPSILDIKPYVPGKAKAAGFSAPIKLSANENALGCSPAARAAYLRAAAEIHRYPDPNATELREAIAAKYDLDPGRIIFGTGSDELFSLACQAYIGGGDNMVQPHYAFAAWAIAGRAAGGEVKSAPERNFHVDVDAMLAAVDARTKVVFVANPANPTGSCIPFAEIERLHAGLPEHVLLVLDGAYEEFALDVPGFAGGLALAHTAPNILVTRTFSKLHGLAALRIGWGYTSRGVADILNRIRLPFNASTPAQMAAVAALADDAFVSASLERAKEGRAELASFLEAQGLVPIESATNFVTAHATAGFTRSAAELERELAERGVLVRLLTNYDMPDALRVTVGGRHEMTRFYEAFVASIGR